MPPPNPNIRRKQLISIASYLVQVVGVATTLYSSPLYWKQDYHTSSLSGEAWVKELVQGHPDRIWTELGVRAHVFLAFTHELRTLCGLEDSRYVSLDEQTAIFLYMCVTGLSVRHVAERFQRSNDTISKYFRRVLDAVSSGPFYQKYVQLPTAEDPTPAYIQERTKFFPYFQNVIGAMDGTHINCCPSAADRQASRNRKGGVSQNCLACVSFSMRFLYFLSGWEGSTADAAMYGHSRLVDLFIPPGKVYLADAGFGICDSLLVPYRGVRYHLAEWGRANTRPANPQELYNLRHASLRNVVERIFGVVKKRWAILVRPPHFDMLIQAKIPPGLAALHNFIMDVDPMDIEEYLTGNDEHDADPNPGQVQENQFGALANGAISQAEKARAVAYRDQIAHEMWRGYQQELQQRGHI